MMSPALSCFREYISLKLFFQGQMDTWRPDSMNRITLDTLYRRPDASVFDTVASEYRDPKERCQNFITAFLRDPTAWAGTVVEDEHVVAHHRRMKVVNSLSRTFISDTDNLHSHMVEKGDSIKNLLSTKTGKPPIMLERRRILGGVTDETLSLIDKAFRFTTQPSHDPLWEKERKRISRYRHFLVVKPEVLKRQFDMLVNNRNA